MNSTTSEPSFHTTSAAELIVSAAKESGLLVSAAQALRYIDKSHDDMPRSTTAREFCRACALRDELVEAFDAHACLADICSRKLPRRWLRLQGRFGGRNVNKRPANRDTAMRWLPRQEFERRAGPEKQLRRPVRPEGAAGWSREGESNDEEPDTTDADDAGSAAPRGQPIPGNQNGWQILDTGSQSTCAVRILHIAPVGRAQEVVSA